jgi:endothelin-converting enzyme/putative endopeptidase
MAKLSHRSSVVALSCALLISSHATAQQAAKPHYGTWGIDPVNMDKTVRPGDDFFGFAEGHWLKTVQIKPDKAGAGYNYELGDLSELAERQIVKEAMLHPRTANERKIADLYKAWMDTKAIEARGLSAAQPYLAKIAALKDRAGLALLMSEPGFSGPINIGLNADAKDPTSYTITADQAGLGLPGRDYYLLPDAKYVSIRKAYHTYIAALLKLAHQPNPEKSADDILALETQMAKDHWTPEQLRDPVASYNPMDRATLESSAPGGHWQAVLDQLGLQHKSTIIVGQPSAIKAAAAQLDHAPLETWQAYLAFHFLSDHAAYLPAAFDTLHFNFYGKTLYDVPSQKPRWKRGIALLDNVLGEAVGEIYVRKHWSHETDVKMGELLTDLRAAYADKINHAAWMDEPTRKEALIKLSTFDPRVGHPAKYIDYTALSVTAHDPLANAMNADKFAWELQRKRSFKPVDRGLWGMTPQTVNAYYDPTMNQITFPAAILQPPFFDPAADPAVNYGETGATIGHEMGHGFDDEGRQFDAQGKLRDWWTPESAKRYTAHAQALVQQYNGYEPIPGVHIKGELTLGENLGDLGGLEAAYAAYHRYLDRHGPAPVIDGYTGDQRFFIAYAQSWQGKVREGALRAQLLSDPHSPEQYRVNGIVRNMDAWYTAFNIQPGSALYLAPEQRVHVW